MTKTYKCSDLYTATFEDGALMTGTLKQLYPRHCLPSVANLASLNEPELAKQDLTAKNLASAATPILTVQRRTPTRLNSPTTSQLNAPNNNPPYRTCHAVPYISAT